MPLYSDSHGNPHSAGIRGGVDPTCNLKDCWRGMGAGEWRAPPWLKSPSEGIRSCRVGKGRCPVRCIQPRSLSMQPGHCSWQGGAGQAGGLKGPTHRRAGGCCGWWGRGQALLPGQPPPQTPQGQVLLPGPPKSGDSGPRSLCRQCTWPGRGHPGGTGVMGEGAPPGVKLGLRRVLVSNPSSDPQEVCDLTSGTLYDPLCACVFPFVKW